jgi:hypothetical protein
MLSGLLGQKRLLLDGLNINCCKLPTRQIIVRPDDCQVTHSIILYIWISDYMLFISSLSQPHVMGRKGRHLSLQLQALNELGRLLHTIINLVRIRALSNSRRRARLATRLTANNRRDSRSPLGAVCAGGFVLLVMSC